MMIMKSRISHLPKKILEKTACNQGRISIDKDQYVSRDPQMEATNDSMHTLPNVSKDSMITLAKSSKVIEDQSTTTLVPLQKYNKNWMKNIILQQIPHQYLHRKKNDLPLLPECSKRLCDDKLDLIKDVHANKCQISIKRFMFGNDQISPSKKLVSHPNFEDGHLKKVKMVTEEKERLDSGRMQNSSQMFYDSNVVNKIMLPTISYAQVERTKKCQERFLRISMQKSKLKARQSKLMKFDGEKQLVSETEAINKIGFSFRISSIEVNRPI